MLSSEST